MTDHEFERAWVGLAREGSCDEPGGAEYQRVKTEWIAAGRPAQVTVFIVQAANRPAPNKADKEEPKGESKRQHVKNPEK